MRTHVGIRSIAVGVALLSMLFVVSGASANIFPTVSSSLTQGSADTVDVTGIGTIIDRSQETSDTALGAHADFSVDFTYKYGATGLTGSGVEDPDTYPPGTDYRESVKNMVVELPPGLVGNPNSIPWAERCEQSVFENGECPDSATVGEIWLEYSLMFESSGNPSALSLIPIGPKRRSGYSNGLGYTKVSLIRTSPEVPARIGVYVRGPVNIGWFRTMLEITPRTDDDLRLRAVTVNNIEHQAWNDNLLEFEDIRIERLFMKLFGTLPNGNNFMTNPTSCQPWTTAAWSQAWFGSSNADADPLGTGANNFVSMPSSTVGPDCSNAASVPFPITGGVSISSPTRDTSPAFDFTIDNPGVQANGQVSTSPRWIQTTIPASINVDVQQLARNCLVTDFNADRCPAGSRVGSVDIKTPLISAGLTGDVYLVKKPSGLPDLGLRVRGAISFTQRGSNRYVGAKFNQIETTFENIPQVGFSKLTFHLDGGPNGLLRSLACPTYNKEPALPTFTYNFTAWTGATKSTTLPLNMKNCFGIQTLKKYRKCLTKTLPVKPNYQSRVRVKKVSLYIDGKRKSITKKSPYRFKLKLNKLKLKRKRTHKLALKAVYDDGTISKKQTTFKVCKK